MSRVGTLNFYRYRHRPRVNTPSIIAPFFTPVLTSSIGRLRRATLTGAKLCLRRARTDPTKGRNTFPQTQACLLSLGTANFNRVTRRVPVIWTLTRVSTHKVLASRTVHGVTLP